MSVLPTMKNGSQISASLVTAAVKILQDSFPIGNA